jgi:hypothetical protein
MQGASQLSERLTNVKRSLPVLSVDRTMLERTELCTMFEELGVVVGAVQKLPLHHVADRDLIGNQQRVKVCL